MSLLTEGMPMVRRFERGQIWDVKVVCQVFE